MIKRTWVRDDQGQILDLGVPEALVVHAPPDLAEPLERVLFRREVLPEQAGRGEERVAGALGGDGVGGEELEGGRELDLGDLTGDGVLAVAELEDAVVVEGHGLVGGDVVDHLGGDAGVLDLLDDAEAPGEELAGLGALFGVELLVEGVGEAAEDDGGHGDAEIADLLHGDEAGRGSGGVGSAGADDEAAGEVGLEVDVAEAAVAPVEEGGLLAEVVGAAVAVDEVVRLGEVLGVAGDEGAVEVEGDAGVPGGGAELALGLGDEVDGELGDGVGGVDGEADAVAVGVADGGGEGGAAGDHALGDGGHHLGELLGRQALARGRVPAEVLLVLQVLLEEAEVAPVRQARVRVLLDGLLGVEAGRLVAVDELAPGAGRVHEVVHALVLGRHGVCRRGQARAV